MSMFNFLHNNLIRLVKYNKKLNCTIYFSIITTLLFMTSCDNYFYSPNDKGVVVSIEKVQDSNRVTIIVIRNSKQKDIDTYLTFLTNKQYNINDTIYFVKK